MVCNWGPHAGFTEGPFSRVRFGVHYKILGNLYTKGSLCAGNFICLSMTFFKISRVAFVTMPA